MVEEKKVCPKCGSNMKLTIFPFGGKEVYKCTACKYWIYKNDKKQLELEEWQKDFFKSITKPCPKCGSNMHPRIMPHRTKRVVQCSACKYFELYPIYPHIIKSFPKGMNHVHCKTIDEKQFVEISKSFIGKDVKSSLSSDAETIGKVVDISPLRDKDGNPVIHATISIKCKHKDKLKDLIKKERK
jgi:DNA-directed RNA polymerase subunit M/transcription elongation factor TFIIS